MGLCVIKTSCPLLPKQENKFVVRYKAGTLFRKTHEELCA